MEPYCTALDWDRIFEYICQRLMAEGFQKKGKLLIRRCGVLITTVYYDRSCPSRPDFHIGGCSIWNCPIEWHLFREVRTMSFRIMCGWLIEKWPASPVFPAQETGKYPVDTFKKYKFADPGSPICWDEFRDILERTLFSAVAYFSTYEGYKANICYHSKPGTYLRAGEWILAMRERNLEWFTFLIDNELHIRSLSAKYPEQLETKFQRHFAIYEAAKAGNWAPAQAYLDELSAPRELILKKYHIKDQAPPNTSRREGGFADIDRGCERDMGTRDTGTENSFQTEGRI